MNFQYKISETNMAKAYNDNVEISTTALVNPYGNGGILISIEELMKCKNNITIYLKAFN
jgi:hypothetical protein